MIDISKIKQRKNFLLYNEYHLPKQNLYILEQSARKGNLSSLEKYIDEWDSYSVEESISLNKVLDIITECLQECNNDQDYIKNKVNYIIENNIISRLSKRNSILDINDFALNSGLPYYNLIKKCNEIFTYDRIIKNQSIIEENLDISYEDDAQEIIVNICELFHNSKLSKEEQYALSLENVLFTIDTVSKRKYIPESTEEIIEMVDMYYGFIFNESFDYNEINSIYEDSGISTFPYVGVSGLLNGVYLNTGISLEQTISRLPKGELKKYEKSNGLKPLEVIDLEASKAIASYANNDYSEAYRTEFVRKKIDGRNYNCMAFYEGSSISKLAILYKKGNDLVAVPIYSRFGECNPTIVHNGISKSVYEAVDEIIYLNEKKRIKQKSNNKNISKVAKKGKESFKKALSKINMKDSKAAKEIEKLMTKFFTKNDDNIIDEVPGVFKCIRMTCLIAATSINPYLGLVTYLTNKFMTFHFERKQREKVLKKYENEINLVKKKIDKCKNEKTKQKYKEYLKKLEEDKRKLEDHYEKFFTDDEIYGGDDNDDDFSFDESTDLLVFNELSVTNKLRLVQQNFKKAITKMSDKEKKLSSQMDNAFDRFTYQIEKNMSNKNREAVIKGSIIPSFSSLIKLALVAGTASFISPVLSAITVLGGFAASKRATNNERKYILDEIDIQLKVVNKKLELAESNNDMKAYEQLLRIKRQLESEKNRIMYKRKRSIVATKYN